MVVGDSKLTIIVSGSKSEHQDDMDGERRGRMPDEPRWLMTDKCGLSLAAHEGLSQA